MSTDSEPREHELAELAADYDCELASGKRSSIELERVQPELASCLQTLHRLWPAIGNQAAVEETWADIGHPLTMFGRFQLKERLASGGFGIVYRAFDPVLKREIALKLPQLGSLIDENLRKRFLREGEAAAALHHPHIVPIYESGTVDEICYLAMAFCSGTTLADWLSNQQTQMTPRDAVKLLLPIVEAVGHAHSQGVIHRDIKPQNILLDQASRFDPFDFTPKLTDFGIARLAATSSGSTTEGTLLGTPQYMSPEQASGSADTAATTDIYSLGAVLYEMVTGKLPIVGNDSTDTLRRIGKQEPLPVKRLSPAVSRDLAAIIHRCLEKSPAQRYPSAADLADDVRRFLAGESTIARPLSAFERAKRWIVRHPLAAALIGTVVVAASVVIGLLTIHDLEQRELNSQLAAALQQSARSTTRAESSEAEARELLYASDIESAARAWKTHNQVRLRELLTRHLPEEDGPDRRGFEWYFLAKQASFPQQVLEGPGPALTTVAFSPNGQWLAVGGETGTIEVFDAETRTLTNSIQMDGQVIDITFCPDSKHIAVGLDKSELQVVDISTKQRDVHIPIPSGGLRQIAWTPDGRQLISCGGDTTIRVWDVDTGAAIGSLTGHPSEVTSIAVSPDGMRLLSGDRDGHVYFWEIDRKAATHRLRCGTHPIRSVAVSGDGLQFGATNTDSLFIIWDDQGQAQVIRQLTRAAHHFRFMPDDGSTLVMTSEAATYLWKPRELQARNSPQRGQLQRWHNHREAISDLAVSPDGDIVATVGEDGRLILTEPEHKPTVRHVHKRRGLDFALLPDTEGMAVVRDGDVSLINRWSGTVIRQLAHDNRQWCRVAISSDGRLLAAGDKMGEIWSWDLTAEDGKQSLAIIGGQVTHLEFSPDSQLLLAGRSTPNGQMQVVDVTARKVVGSVSGPNHGGAGFVSDNLVWFFRDSLQPEAAWSQELVRWRVHDGTIATVSTASESRIRSIAISDDSQTAVTGGEDSVLRVWNKADAKISGALKGGLAAVNSVALSPDDQTLAVADETGALWLWHVPTRQSLFKVQAPQPFRKVAFSVDGRQLAGLTAAGDLHLYDTRLPVESTLSRHLQHDSGE